MMHGTVLRYECQECGNSGPHVPSLLDYLFLPTCGECGCRHLEYEETGYVTP